MDAGKLKVIAEGMRYKTCSTGYGEFIAYGCMDKNNIYNPLTNNDQMVEIMEKFAMSINFSEHQTVGEPETKETYVSAGIRSFDADGAFQFMSESGKTINEAVCNAAYEYFKGEHE